MNTALKGALIALLAILTPIVIVALLYVSTSNREVGLRNALVAQQKNSAAVFDNTWKIISQQAQVSEQYRDSFKGIYAEIMDARYANGGGELMKWITEHNPQFDASLFKQLMVSIEGQRALFTREQTKLLDLKREHDNIRLQFPGSLFLASRPAVEVVIVTSAKTEAAFASGQDDNVTLFEKK